MTLSLQGCIALEVGHLAGIALSPRTTIRSFDDVRFIESERIYSGRFFQQTNLFNKANRCEYDVTMVTYARDWEKVDAVTGAKWEAKPDEIAGVAYLAYKEYCPGQPSKDILKVAESSYNSLFGRKYLIRDGSPAEVEDYFSIKPEDRPKWMPQVLSVLESAKSTNDAAKIFLDATAETRKKL